MCGLSQGHRAVELGNGDDTSGKNLQWESTYFGTLKLDTYSIDLQFLEREVKFDFISFQKETLLLMWKRNSGRENIETERPVRKMRDNYSILDETWHFGTLVEAVKMKIGLNIRHTRRLQKFQDLVAT